MEELLMEMKELLLEIYNNIKLSDAIALLVSLGSFLLSIKSLRWSKKAHNTSINLTKQINSKEYQLNENLKETAVQIIAVVRSIDAKVALTLDNNKLSYGKDYKLEFSYEIKLLAGILSSPSYILFLKAIVDDELRYNMELYLQKLYIIISSKIEFDDYKKIRSWCLLILQQLDFYKIVDIKDPKLCEFIAKLSLMKGVLTKEY